MHASNGIAFNAVSRRGGNECVTRKICSHVVRIKLGLAKRLSLGSLEARRDWGHAQDYVGAMWTMLQQDSPADYVIASGETHSVSEFFEIAFDYVGLNPNQYVVQDPALYRPTDVSLLQVDTAKASNHFGWKYTRTFRSLVEEMVDWDLRRYRGELRD